MNPPVFPSFTVREFSVFSNSNSAEEESLIIGISFEKAFRFFFISVEIPEKRRIAGDQPCLLKTFAKTGAREEPSSVIKQRGFSGSSECSTSGGSSETELAKLRVT